MDNKLNKKENTLRSIVKAITWRIIATSTTFLLAMFFFKSDPSALEKASWVALAEILIKTLLYYLHERFWVNLK